MRRSVVAILLVGALVGYVLASWMSGKQAEAVLDRQYGRLAESPYVKVVDRQYQRGLFSSEETVTFELFGDEWRARTPIPPDAATGEAQSGPPRVTVHSRIVHGPLPGVSVPAAAAIDSELRLAGDIVSGLNLLFGANQPLTAHTRIGFTGSVTTRLQSPGFTTTMASAADTPPAAVVWEGVQLDLSFGRNLVSYDLRGEAPRLRIDGEKATILALEGVRLEGEQTRVFDDDPLLYSGTQKLTLDQFTFDSAAATGAGAGVNLHLEKASFEVDTPLQGDIIDFTTKLALQLAQLNGQDFGPVSVDLSLAHLNARSLAKLNHALIDFAPAPGMAPAMPDPLRMAPLFAPLMELLAGDPEIRLQRLSFVTPHGEAKASATVKVAGLTPLDLIDPTLLLAKLDATADVSVPAALLAPAGPQAVDETQIQRAQLIRAFTTLGYLRNEGGQLSTQLVARGGRITLNGRPFNPAGLTAGPASR